MLVAFDNVGVHHILHVRRSYWCPLQNFGTASALQVCRHSPYKEDPPTSAHTVLHVAQANWRPAEDMGIHNQGISLRICYARWRNGWLKVSNELALDHRSWDADTRDLVNSIGDAGSTG